MSFQARVFKKLLVVFFSGWADGTVAEQRARQEKSNRFNRLPGDVHCSQVSANGIPGEWIESPGADAGVLLYLHGGAYALGSIDGHREWISRMAKATHTRALAINYRLAPEDPFPAALADTVTTYRWLLAQGIDPAQIIIAGDSAGGGLALAASLALRDAGEPLPAGIICLSPWLDLTLSGKSIQSNAKLDPILSEGDLQKYAAYYAGDHDLATPLISPIFADLTGLPPLLVQAGTDEVLLGDAQRLVENAQKAGVSITVGLWEKMFHVFQLFAFLPETKDAVKQIAEFAATVLPSATDPHS